MPETITKVLSAACTAMDTTTDNARKSAVIGNDVLFIFSSLLKVDGDCDYFSHKGKYIATVTASTKSNGKEIAFFGITTPLY